MGCNIPLLRGTFPCVYITKHWPKSRDKMLEHTCVHSSTLCACSLPINVFLTKRMYRLVITSCRDAVVYFIQEIWQPQIRSWRHDCERVFFGTVATLSKLGHLAAVIVSQPKRDLFPMTAARMKPIFRPGRRVAKARRSTFSDYCAMRSKFQI